MLSPTYEENNFIKRTIFSSQVDGESAIWQLINIYKNPAAVFRWIRAHRHTKGTWSRDDPGFFLLELLVILCISLFWFILPFTPYSMRCFFQSIISFVFIDFVFIGVLFASAVFLCLSKWGKSQSVSSHASDQDIEWKFCFDCFTNSFVAIIADIDFAFIVIYIIRKILFSVSKVFFAKVFLPNFLIFIAYTHFTILFVQCIQVLPFIKRMNFIIYCIPIFLFFMLSIAFSFPLFDIWMSIHFGVPLKK